MAKNKRKDFTVEIEIPAEIDATVEKNKIVMKKGGKELTKKISDIVNLDKEGSRIILSVKKAKKIDKREFGTAKSHIKNMIEGLMTGFEYELEICNVHFPITVIFDKAKSEFIIKNQLGEKCPRIIKTPGDIEVEIKIPRIKIKSYDLDKAGQAAASLEKRSMVRNRDRNKFQDGIFIIKKPGVEFL